MSYLGAVLGSLPSRILLKTEPTAAPVETDPSEKLARLSALMREMGSVLVCYSGGIDSALVLAVAARELGGRAIGKSYADPANHVKMDPYAVLDAALYYRFSVIELAVNANNLLGAERYFVSSINDTQLTPGQPRIVMGSLRISQ